MEVVDYRHGCVPAPSQSGDVELITGSEPRLDSEFLASTPPPPPHGVRQLRSLVVEDEFVCRSLLGRLLAPFGVCDAAVDGEEAYRAFRLAWTHGTPYELICLDICMPGMNGQETLKAIRTWEEANGILLGKGVKIIMTTILNDAPNVLGAFNSGCECYLVKPVARDRLLETMRTLGIPV